MELVECKKYHARLTLEACVARYDRSVRDLKAGEYRGDPGCRVCEVGESRTHFIHHRKAFREFVKRTGNFIKRTEQSGAMARRRRVPDINKMEDAPMTETIKLKCSKCKEMLPLESFNNHKANTHRHGKQNYCRECHGKLAAVQPHRGLRAKPANTAPVTTYGGVVRGEMLPEIVAGDGPPESVCSGFIEVGRMQNTVLIDFANHPDLEEFVTETAREEFRTPDAQVLALIQYVKKMREVVNAR